MQLACPSSSSVASRRTEIPRMLDVSLRQPRNWNCLIAMLFSQRLWLSTQTTEIVHHTKIQRLHGAKFADFDLQFANRQLLLLQNIV
jgi:hypothetical protein